jgi:omega-6 fatty acid desaturase (delta-12 desaturase)
MTNSALSSAAAPAADAADSAAAPRPPRAVASKAGAVPGVQDVRANMGDDARAKSTLKGVLFCAVSLVPYFLGFAGFFVLDGWWLKGLSAAVMTVSLPMLFIVGHDACHQSLTPHRWLNKLIGRLTMVPTWHAYSVWDLGHNGMHHAWTNVRGKDFTWTPLSADEYARLTPVGRLMHRLYRTWWGVGIYYIIEIWTKYGMTGARAQTPRMNVLFWLDRLSVVGHTVVVTAAALLLTDRTGLGSNPILVSAGLLLLGVVVPFLVWNWTMGMIVLVHHTHPTIPWYGDVEDWSYYAGQVQATVHVELPRPVELVLHNIMEHTAHHADPRVPLYNLEKAQKHLEDTYGSEITVVPFSLAGLFETLRTCRLFDYENHRWLDWDGTPTTEPLLKRRDGRLVRAA